MALGDPKLKKIGGGEQAPRPPPPLPKIRPPSALQISFPTWRTLSKSYATQLQRATWRYSEGGRFMEVQLYLDIS